MMKNLWLLFAIIAVFAVFVQSDYQHESASKPIFDTDDIQ
uniref:Sel1 repeat family protein n=1 Tax=Schistosoma mansoni TaxID=6183 RepID=A0A5K4F9B1_SCHMA